MGLVFRSIGYKGLGVEGVPFNEEKGVVPNQEGRVIDEAGKPISGLYVTGWIKRGPSGVIGTNRKDSKETVTHLLSEIETLNPAPNRDTERLLEPLKAKNHQWVNYQDWEKINEEEIKRGEQVGKPREKFTKTEDMLNFLNKA